MIFKLYCNEPCYKEAEVYVKLFAKISFNVFVFRFNSTDGMFSNYQKLEPIPPSVGPITPKLELEEDTVAPFYCSDGCGGGMIDVFDITKYAQGDCVAQDQCL